MKSKNALTVILKVVSTITLTYLAMCFVGLVLESKMLLHVAEAIINCSSAIFEFIARILGSEPTSGDLMPGAPTEMKIALSAIFFGLIGSACAIAEIKLKIDSMDIPEPSIHNLKMKMVGDTK